MSHKNRFKFLDDIQDTLKLIDDMSSISGIFNVDFRDQSIIIFESKYRNTKLMTVAAGVGFCKTFRSVLMVVYLLSVGHLGTLKLTTINIQMGKRPQPSDENPTRNGNTILTSN